MNCHKLLVLILTQNIPFVLFTYCTTPIVPEEIICHIHGLSQVKNASNSGKSTSTAHCNVKRYSLCSLFLTTETPWSYNIRKNKMCGSNFKFYTLCKWWHNIESPKQDNSKWTICRIQLLWGSDTLLVGS